MDNNEMKIKRIILFYILFFTGAALAFGFGYMTRFFQEQYQTKSVRFPILEEAFEVLNNHAYENLPEDPKMEYGMIRGMVDAYNDPYTHFVEPVQHELDTDQLSGSYGGIGASLDYDPDMYICIHPFPDGPATAAGIKDGDRLISVDKIVIPPSTPLDQAIAAIRGPEGTKVSIVVSRPPKFEVLSFRIERKDIPLPSITWHQDISEPRLGLVKVNLIAETTVNEIQNAIKDLTDQGSTHFVIDLRGNRGGILTIGVDIARLFLKDGAIILEHYRGQEIKTYQVEKPGPFVKIPLVVLVDGNTASAAEIIAGALKYHDRAKIIGTETFGKNSIQLVFGLTDGSSLHVTAAKWWTPDLESEIEYSGVYPDIIVTDENTNGDEYIQAAINVLFNLP